MGDPDKDLAELDRMFGVNVRKNVMPVPVKIFRVHPDAVLPKYAHEGDSGMDLVTPFDILLAQGVPFFVDTGIAVALPDGYEFQIRSRSGLTKQGVTACSGLGTVDSGYRSTIGVVLLWHHHTGIGFPVKQIPAGSRIAQMVLQRVPRVQWQEVDSADALGVTERGANGHGSSGL